MQLGTVIGTLVATHKDPSLQGVKLLVVQPLDAQQQPAGAPLVAVDGTHQAGEGDLVGVVGGREGALTLNSFNPADQGIAAIVDAVDVAPFQRGI